VGGKHLPGDEKARNMAFFTFKVVEVLRCLPIFQEIGFRIFFEGDVAPE